MFSGIRGPGVRGLAVLKDSAGFHAHSGWDRRETIPHPSRRHACHTSQKNLRYVKGRGAPSPYAASKTLAASVTPLPV